MFFISCYKIRNILIVTRLQVGSIGHLKGRPSVVCTLSKKSILLHWYIQYLSYKAMIREEGWTSEKWKPNATMKFIPGANFPYLKKYVARTLSWILIRTSKIISFLVNSSFLFFLFCLYEDILLKCLFHLIYNHVCWRFYHYCCYITSSMYLQSSIDANENYIL